MKRRRSTRKKWPACEAPFCEKEADELVRLDGQCGFFKGHLCIEHASMLRRAFPANMSMVMLLRPINGDMIDEALK